MKKLVFDMLGEEDAKKARKEMRARGYAEEVIDSEIVADSLFDVLSEKGIIKEMSKETRVTVSEMLRHLSDSIREMLSRLTGTETWRIELRDKATNYRHLSNMFMNAMDTAADDVQRAELVEDIRGEVRYSIKYTTDNKPVVVVTENILDGVPESEWVKTVKDTIRNKFPNGIPISGRLIKVNGVTRSEFTNSKYSKHLKSNDKVIYKDKFKAANNLDEIVLASTNYINEDLNHSRKDRIVEFARGDVLLRIGESDYAAKVIVGFTSGKQMLLYDIVDFTKTVFTIKNKDSSIDFGKNRNLRSELSSDNTISQNKGIVNTIISENSENDSTKRQSKKKETVKTENTFGKKISPAMTDSERYEILKDLVIEVAEYEGEADEQISVYKEDLDSKNKNLFKKALLKIGEYFNIFNVDGYKNDNCEIEVFISRGTLKESSSKLLDNPAMIVKLFPKIDIAIKNAIGIETHNNRYYFDDSTVSFTNLLGGYIDGNYFVPVRFGLKTSVNGKNSLYVLIDQSKIKKDRVIKQFAVANYSRLSTISIAEILKNVNSKDILRYVPDNFLDETRKKVKYEAIAETVKRTNDKIDNKYIGYIGKGDAASAQRMITLAANSNGYNSPVVMHGTYDARIVDRYGEPHDGTVFTVFDSRRSLADNKDGSAYFFTDNNKVAGLYAQKSEFADTNRRYYSEPKVYNAYLKLGKTYTIDAKGSAWNRVPIPDGCKPKTYNGKTTATKEFCIWAKANGYDSVVFKNIIDGDARDSSFIGTVYAVFEPEQIKSADLVTYDDEGNIIPLSERFRTDRTDAEAWKNEDIRFSKKKEPVKALKAEDVFGKDYKAEFEDLKEDIKNLKNLLAALKVEEIMPSEEVKERRGYLNTILKNKRARFKRIKNLQAILAQTQKARADTSRYAKLFLDNFQAVKKTGSYRATGENWEIMKTVSEITDTYEPTVSDFATKAGLAKLQKEHKQIYDAFMAYAQDKAYIRPFNLSEYKSVLEKLAKEYKAEGADISGLAAELKNAVEIYLNKAADKQPSYEALVREFDVILSDITEKSEKLADKSEWAQKIKGQTVKLVGDQYRNVIDIFGSLAEANRYMNGAVKFSLMLVFCPNTDFYWIPSGPRQWKSEEKRKNMGNIVYVAFYYIYMLDNGTEWEYNCIQKYLNV